MDTLTSVNNDRVKFLVKLRTSAKERKYSGRYIVEGVRMTKEIPYERLGELYMTRDFYMKVAKGNEDLAILIRRADNDGKAFIVADNVMKRIADTETPQGILATVKIYESRLDDILGNDSQNPLILILETIQDPGNMGTIIRSAEGAGVTGLLVSYDSVDIYSPKVIRSTMGSIFRKKVVVSYDLMRDIKYLKSKGIDIYGMHLKGVSMYKADLTGPIALLIGNEGSGLSEDVSNAADKLIKIPMKGELESLNAASSATIISYEAMRQRDNKVSVDINDIFY